MSNHQDVPSAQALERKLNAARRILDQLRTAASPMPRLDDLAKERCPVCGPADAAGRSDLAVCRYPAFRSPLFAGRLLCQCQSCGLAWIPGEEVDLDAFYRADYAKSFAQQRLFKGPFYGPDNPLWLRPPSQPLKRARAHAAGLARFGPFERVFDLGAGVGYFLNAIEAAEKHGMELDPYAARILTEELGVQLSQIGEHTARFDLVMASHVLEHFTQTTLPVILTEIFAALKPGGHFFVEVPAGALQLTDFALGKRAPTQRLEPHTLFFSSYALHKLIRAAGFDIKEATVCGWSTAQIPAAERDAVYGGIEPKLAAAHGFILTVLAERPTV